MSNKFHRGERLKSRKEIGRLFGKEGKSANSYPIRMVYTEAQEARGTSPFQATFVVPKRKFKLAVDRNLIKRRMKEAYRLEKENLLARTQEQGELEKQGKQHALMFIYTGKEAMPFKYIKRKMGKVLEQLK
jgi:ribonuclease P protein component